jgi:hypothetical protein
MGQEQRYTNKHKKQLFEKIDSLSKTEHEEIYKILKDFSTKSEDSSIKFSKNKNGIFFNLSDIADELYDELDKFVQYCMNNKKDLDDYDKRINECKINNNFTNIIHLNLETLPRDKSNSMNVKKTVDWNSVAEPKSVQKVANYIERLMIDNENVGKKNVNAKFNNAKKKYAKKVASEKKLESEGIRDLMTEAYLITT